MSSLRLSFLNSPPDEFLNDKLEFSLSFIDYSCDDSEHEESLEYIGNPMRMVIDDEIGMSKPLMPLNFTNYRSFETALDIPPQVFYSDAGTITKAGLVNKRNGKANRFHKRYIVLRAFRLFWYNKETAKKARGTLVLPTQAI
jgi:hypothetical protein